MDTLPASKPAMPLAELLFSLLYSGGVRDIVIAPGSRSAPLTIAAVRHGGFRPRLVYDERSAAYTALGIAQQTSTPVAVICSSGTAALNFGPAVAEAYYQQIPLLCLTADRPAEWIDQIDNQALRQERIFADHVRGLFRFPVDDGVGETRWHAARIVHDALVLLKSTPAGPVHINVPLREPLYGSVLPPIAPDARLRTAVRTLSVERQIDPASFAHLATVWNQAQRKLIIAGQLPPDPALRASLDDILTDPGAVLIGDITSNLVDARSNHALTHWEAALYARDASAIAPLLPDLAIWIGGQVTSKAIKALLRKHPPKHFWRVDPNLPAADPFQANTVVIPSTAATFLSGLCKTLRDLPDTPHASSPAYASNGIDESDRLQVTDDYANTWRIANNNAGQLLSCTLSSNGFSELNAVQQTLAALPPQTHLQIGNSMPIRLINLLGIPAANTPQRIDSNRGVSGIDGTVSTAVGAASATDAVTTLIVGDLGFFYDRNGLWQSPLPANLRIVLLNNHGGGIFDVIEGPDTLPADERRSWFLTPNPLRAERTAADHGLRYYHADSAESLKNALATFFQPGDSPALLEIETDMTANSALWRRTLSNLRERKSANPGGDAAEDVAANKSPTWQN